MKLALGTVQFGLAYGIANSQGQVGQDEARAILSMARAAGMDTLDTAVNYGTSEECLGTCGIADWQVISKLPACPEGEADIIGWAERQVVVSLDRLAVPRLRGLLLHRPAQLLGPDGDALFQALQALKRLGLVERIGVSIYDPAELEPLLARFPLDLVQAPFNVLDRRLISSGWMNRLAEMQVELHVRSVFLQGLLLMPASRRPAAFSRWQSIWQLWTQWLAQTDQTPVEACLRDALAQQGIARVIIGVDSTVQFEEILRAAVGPNIEVPAALHSDDIDLINPSRWRIP
jgi:aryl-alcohol dehydrogenase-like predicted oxidoreductase